MSWQLALVIALAALFVAVVIVAAVLNSKLKKARAETARVKGQLAQAADDVERLLNQIEIGRLSDGDLAKRLVEGLRGWRAVDGDGAGVDGGGAGGGAGGG